MSALFRVQVEREADSACLVLVGELDIGTRHIADRALERVHGDGIRRLVVDLRPITFIGSTGLRLLFELAAACERDGRELVLVKGSPAVDRLVELVGIEDQLPFVSDDREDGDRRDVERSAGRSGADRLRPPGGRR